MKRWIKIFMVVLCMSFFVAGCGDKKTSTPKVIEAVDGYAEGRMGDILRNSFFEYNVKSAQYVKEYAGYKPQDGYVLVDAVVEIKNIFGEPIPMFYDDFQIQWSDGDKDFGYSIEAIDDTMIPDEFELKRGETKEYHCVYEVPEGYTDYSISYLEIFEDKTEGDVFFVYFELN